MPGALISMPCRPAPGQSCGGPLQRLQVRRRLDRARLRIEEERRKGRDPGKTPSGQSIEAVGDPKHVGGFEAALVTAIEAVALGLDAGQEILPAPPPHRSRSGFGRLLEVEDRPIVRRQRCGGIRLGARNLHEMTDMADLESGSPARAGAFHVDRHDLVDAAAPERRAEGSVAPHLLRHGEEFEAVTVGLGAQRPGIRFGRVEVDHVGIRRDLAGLMEPDRLLDQARIAAAEQVQEHLEPSVSEPFRAASARLRRG